MMNLDKVDKSRKNEMEMIEMGSKELIKINMDESSDRPTVSARELHDFLGVETDFRHWFTRMIEYGFSDGTDFARVVQKCPTLGGMQDMVDYQLTIDMAKELCMIQRNERGKQARRYFLSIEKQWNDPVMVMSRALKMADKQIKKLTDTNKRQSKQIEADKPYTDFGKHVTVSNNSIDIGTLAKIAADNGVKIGRNRLFEFLRENKILYRDEGYNVPYQAYIDREWFKVKYVEMVNTYGSKFFPKISVTGIGQVKIVNMLLKNFKNKVVNDN